VLNACERYLRATASGGGAFLRRLSLGIFVTYVNVTSAFTGIAILYSNINFKHLTLPPLNDYHIAPIKLSRDKDMSRFLY
jgi:hypothetical protein